MKDLNIKIDPELKTFMNLADELARLECAFWEHQWRTFPSSTGPVVICVRCGERLSDEPRK
jgi:hypothetical protein